MGYTVDGLKHGIERCEVNIASLEQAIANERNTIKEYKLMIDDIERAAEDKKDIVLEAVREEDD